MIGIRCHKCQRVNAVNDVSGWVYSTSIHHVTGERTIEWRCDRCNFHAAVGVPERVKRGQRNGGKASAAISRGATDERGKLRSRG